MKLVSESRVAAAAALRELNHALVAHEADDALLDRIADAARTATAELRPGARRDRATALASQVQRLFSGEPREPSDSDVDATTIGDAMADRAVAGYANPTACELAVTHEDDVVVRVTLGAAHEGAPRRAHGGIVAAVFDDVTGAALHTAGAAAYTGTLEVMYHEPVPIEVELVFRARATEREGRRLFVTSECYAGDTMVASCKVTFITVSTEAFGTFPD